MLGWSRDIKFEKHNIWYGLLVSPDQTTFAVIGAGMIMAMPLRATWLYTPMADGRTFYSTDNQNGVSLDVSRNWTTQLVFAPAFPALWRAHQEWLGTGTATSAGVARGGVSPRKFTRGRELDELRAVREEHFCAMERAGLIRYTDASATHFQFTLTGAARSATWGYLVGIARRVTQGRFPRAACFLGFNS